MSRIHVDNIYDKEGSGAPSLPAGAIVTGVSTFSAAVNVNSDMTFDGSGNNLRLNDNSVLEFGTGNDLNIFHNTSLSVIRDGGAGGLLIDSDNEIKLAKNGTGNDSMAVFTVDGSAELYYDGVKKIETTNHGVVITGVATATSFVGNITGDVTGNVTGNVVGNINASSATGISTVGILTAYGGVSDAIGPLRRLGITAHNAGTLTLDTSHAGNLIREQTNSANITVPQNVFTPGDMITIFNASGGDNTITQGTGVTLYNTADAATGNRTLAAKGVCTLACTASNEFVISGSGLS